MYGLPQKKMYYVKKNPVLHTLFNNEASVFENTVYKNVDSKPFERLFCAVCGWPKTFIIGVEIKI